MSDMVIFGEVTRIVTVPSRQVCRIEIELPIEAYVAAVNAVHGRPVLVTAPEEVPAGGYGVHTLQADAE